LIISDISHGGVCVGDVNNDGLNDVIAGTNDGTSYVWSTKGDARRIEWGSYRYNAQNNGVYEKKALFGMLPENTQISWNGKITICGDVTLPQSSTLTIEPGTEILFENGDVEQGGEDPDKSELIINGQLIANGTEQNRIEFGPKISVPGYSWYGIVVGGGVNPQTSYCNFSKAFRAIYIKPEIPEPNKKTIDHCNFSDCYYGLYISGNAADILHCSISGSEAGIYGLSADVTVYNNTLQNNVTGISLFESQFQIYENSINANSDYGIYLGHSPDGEISNNILQNNCTNPEPERPLAAIYLYGSSPAIYANQIYSNAKNGILLFNKSLPLIQESNLLQENGPNVGMEEPAWEKAEVLMEDISTPFMVNGHNDVIDSRQYAGFLLMHAGEPEEVIDVTANYWGGGSPEGRLYPEEYFIFDGWDLEPNVTGVPGGRDMEEQLFLNATEAEKQGNYNTAKITYQQIVANYPDSVEAAYSLSRLFACEQSLNGDFSQLRNYYSNLGQTINDSVKIEIANNFSRRCYVKEMLYSNAIVDYEAILQNSPSLIDSIYAVIDIGDIYLLQDELSGGSGINFKISTISGATVNPKIAELKPESRIRFEKKKGELLSLLFNKLNGERQLNIPKCYALEQNYPNPFNPVTTIKYQLPKASKVKLEIYNILGQKVKTLIDSEQPADYYEIKWAGDNNHGIKVGSGIYIYRIYTKSLEDNKTYISSKKMLLVK